METMEGAGQEESFPVVRELTSNQRRVLGALLEKAFTTPDQYPLTVKSLTAACSQKSNRDPVQEFTEDEVAEALTELQGLGLVAEVHTDGGRTPRYRHLMRKRFTLTEPQFAILTELWLRGRQQMGELRTRAGRMAPIESQEELRAALQSLLADGFVRASGPLERRGVEVDHGFYPAGERQPGWSPVSDEPAVRATPASAGGVGGAAQESLRALTERVRELEQRIARLEQTLETLTR
jgi:uncharacterized protein YceH (UPF0502 family)